MRSERPFHPSVTRAHLGDARPRAPGAAGATAPRWRRDSIDCDRDARLCAYVHPALLVLAVGIAWGEFSVLRLLCA